MHHILKLFLSFITLQFTVAATIDNTPLRTPPANFTWKKLPEIKGAILLPDGWHFKSVKGKGTSGAYFFSKEKIGKSGSYQTGLSLNYQTNITQKTGLKASVYANQYMNAAASKIKLIDPSSTNSGPFHAVKFKQSRPSTNFEKTTFVQHLCIANDKTGTVYLILFEAPQDNWESASKISDIMLKTILLDDKI